MNRYKIRNNTGSEIFVEGQWLNSSGNSGDIYTISIEEIYIFRESDDLRDFIESGDVSLIEFDVVLTSDEAIRSLDETSEVLEDDISFLVPVRKTNYKGNVSLVKTGNDSVDVFIGTSLAGLSYSMFFTENGTAKDEWLGCVEQSNVCNSTPGVIPFNSKLIAITFSNRKSGVDADIKIWRSPEGNGTGKALAYCWDLTNKRTAWKTNFPSDINFLQGDKVAVYINDDGEDAQSCTVQLILQVTDPSTGEGGENYNGDFSGGNW